MIEIADRLQRKQKVRQHPDFIPHRDVPAHWQTDLETVVPRSERVSWLKLVWQPGMFYDPLGRWEIYELEPNLNRVAPDILADLQGEDPRLRGEWIADPSVPEIYGGKRWASHALHSRVQWQLHRETNCYPIRFWIIQGTHGGHVWRMDRAKKLFHAGVGLPDVPNPGDLPYAEWNQRVKQQLLRFDRLRKWTAQRGLPWDQRALTKSGAGLWVAQESYANEQQYQAELFKWFDEQIHEAVYDLPLSMVPSGSDLPMLPGVQDHVAGKEYLDERLRTSTAHAPWEES